MSLLEEISRIIGGPWFLLVLICIEIAVGLFALRNTRRECRVHAVRQPHTVAVMWACFLMHTLVIAVAAWYSMWPLPIPPLWGIVSGVVAAAAGLAFAVAGFWEFRSLQRMSGLANDRLVTSGIYRFSRNPQNLGWGLMLLGIGLAGHSGLGCVLALGYWAVFNHYVATEEKHLSWVFSEKWDRYAAQTPRFLTLTPLWKPATAGQPSPNRPAAARGQTIRSLNITRESEPLR